MACKVTRDDFGNVTQISCGSPWGIGIYESEWGSVYGFPPAGLDPRMFTPDRECCSPDEIAAWESALASVEDEED